MYKVINRFKENHHDGYIYEKGDTYPADGKKLVKTRAEYLTKVHKDYGVAFLEAVEEPKKGTTKQLLKDPSKDETREES